MLFKTFDTSCTLRHLIRRAFKDIRYIVLSDLKSKMSQMS